MKLTDQPPEETEACNQQHPTAKPVSAPLFHSAVCHRQNFPKSSCIRFSIQRNFRVGSYRESLRDQRKSSKTRQNKIAHHGSYRKETSRRANRRLRREGCKGFVLFISWAIVVELPLTWCTDFDPENEVPDDSENSDSDESVNERAGTEHYVSVGYVHILGQLPQTI